VVAACHAGVRTPDLGGTATTLATAERITGLIS
jgi:hypothetical protein